MALKAIIFDCFGVLIKAGRMALHNRFPDKVDQLSRLERDSDMGNISRIDFLEAVAKLTGLDSDEIVDRYYFTDKRGYNQSAIDWARQIKKEGQYKVGLLSNVGRGWLDHFLSDIEDNTLFDAEVLSGEVGLIKPDPKVFKLMAKKLGLRPEECLMIDDLAPNIKGAKQAGMLGIIFESTKQAQLELAKITKK